MSKYYVDDVVSLGKDGLIIGHVRATWSDQADLPDEELTHNLYYYPHEWPGKVAWEIGNEIIEGFLLISFLHERDGLCIASEKDLQLVDRGLAIGDVVKGSLADSMSGTVVSTSIDCTVQPCCSVPEFEDYKNYDACIAPVKEQDGPSNDASRRLRERSCISDVSASDLKHHFPYREGDCIIYNDWIGRIDDYVEEVTIRLSNGTVVTVDDPDELSCARFSSRNKPRGLVHDKLTQMDYDFRISNGEEDQINDILDGEIGCSDIAEGQIVQTKKANLRKGIWRHGKYDPNVRPIGMVVEVRCIALNVDWIFAHVLNGQTAGWQRPPPTLTTDELDSGNVLAYDHSLMKSIGDTARIEQACHSLDTSFGGYVRFRDPESATTEQHDDSTNNFKRIPRAATLGYEMNILQVRSTLTRVKVLWQDQNMSEEVATSLVPYEEPDDHEVWPGSRVSHQPSEETREVDDSMQIHATKLGIVQSVDTVSRIAAMRWYQKAHALVSSNGVLPEVTTYYGAVASENQHVPLYDIVAHASIDIDLGAMVYLLPEPMACCDRVDVADANASLGMGFGFGTHEMTKLLQRLQCLSINPTTHPSIDILQCFGEIVELCTDGDVVVRLGASKTIEEHKVPRERVLIVPMDSLEDSEEGSEWGDRESETDYSSDSHDTIHREISENSDSKKRKSEDILDDWETDDEHTSIQGKRQALSPRPHHDSSAIRDVPSPIARISPSAPSAPTPFRILETESAPADHYYLKTATIMNASLMRRIRTEHKALSEGLPTNVWVRTWSERLDLLRVLIVGAVNTPYEHAPFVFDIQLPNDYPKSPPSVFFHSWTASAGRISPNLYEDGTVCLSLLGTWHSGVHCESWHQQKSTLLQVVVSILGLVLVRDPYFNEAGYERYSDLPEHRRPNTIYNETVYIKSKRFIKTALEKTPVGLDDIVAYLYKDATGLQLLPRIWQEHKLLLEATSSIIGEKVQEEECWASRGELSVGAKISLARVMAWMDPQL